MKVALFAHGTRGDISPIVSLAWQLTQGDHDVTIAVPGEFREFTERAGLRTVSLPFDMTAWLRTAEGQRLLHRGGVSLMRRLAREFERHAEAFDSGCVTAAQGAEALVGNQITCDRVLALGDALKVPAVTFCPFPITPSREYSSLVLTRGRLRSPGVRRASHELHHRLWWRQVAGEVDAFRGKLGLRPSPEPTYRRLLRDDCNPWLYGFSSSIFSRPADWPGHVEVTAAWGLPGGLRDDLGEGLSADLEGWLEAGEPPVFLGFGSMPVLDPEPLLADVAAVTEALGMRAIISENCVPAGAAGSLPARLRVVGTVDHDRLFPRCAAVVHHGGIGSITASLRAGRPTMACSVFSDQPWWGEHLKRLGVGAHVPFRKLDRASLESGLRVLLDPRLAHRSEVLGEAIRVEGDGLPEATRWLENWLGVGAAVAAA